MHLAHMGKRGTTDRRRFYRCAHGLSVPTISILPSFPHFTSPTKLRKANQIGPEGIWDLRARHTAGEVHGSRSTLPCPLAGCSVHPWVHPKSILLFKFPPGWETHWRKRGAAGTDRRGFLQPGIPTGSGQQPLSSLPILHLRLPTPVAIKVCRAWEGSRFPLKATDELVSSLPNTEQSHSLCSLAHNREGDRNFLMTRGSGARSQHFYYLSCRSWFRL